MEIKITARWWRSYELRSSHLDITPCISGIKESFVSVLLSEPTGKRPLGRPRRRWEDNIRMDLEEIVINAGNWVDSAQDKDYWRALVNAALNLPVP